MFQAREILLEMWKLNLMFTPDQLEAIAQAEKLVACKHCNRVVLAGPPCCSKAVYDLYRDSQKEIKWLRKIQSKQSKRIEKLQKELFKYEIVLAASFVVFVVAWCLKHT